MNKQDLGKKGEELALTTALARGYSVLGRNFRCPLGEIDLVLQKEDLVVFMEVKTRRGDRYGEAWEAVTKVKRERIRRVAAWFCQEQALGDLPCRFDVFTIQMGPVPWQHHWFEDAF